MVKYVLADTTYDPLVHHARIIRLQNAIFFMKIETGQPMGISMYKYMAKKMGNEAQMVAKWITGDFNEPLPMYQLIRLEDMVHEFMRSKSFFRKYLDEKPWSHTKQEDMSALRLKQPDRWKPGCPQHYDRPLIRVLLVMNYIRTLTAAQHQRNVIHVMSEITGYAKQSFIKWLIPSDKGKINVEVLTRIESMVNHNLKNTTISALHPHSNLSFDWSVGKPKSKIETWDDEDDVT